VNALTSPPSTPTQSVVALIDDDVRLAQMLTAYLQGQGFTVWHASTALSGLKMLSERGADVLLLDWMLPDMDGLNVCQRIRSGLSASAAVPILMLTAKGDPMDRVAGLEGGADDYLPKPFEPLELLARVRALLRRSERVSASARAEELVFGDLHIDKAARRLSKAGQVRELTSHQFDLLWTLASHAGQALSRERIMALTRGKELDAFDRSIDVHMGHIRNVVEDNPKEPQRIVTVRGVGYVFAKNLPGDSTGGAA
jgi:DNA-binding response OmpR family regulator